MFEYKNLKINFHPLVYEPSEDTFLLAKALEEAMAKLPANAEALEIGTGTGIISLILSKKCKTVLGTDINQYALNLARENAETNAIDNVEFIFSNLFTG